MGKKWGKLIAKTGLTVLLLIMFCLLIKRDRQERGMPTPEGEKIRTEDAVCLVEALGRKMAFTEGQKEALEEWSLQVGKEEFLTYGAYIELVSIWDQSRQTEREEEGSEQEPAEKYRREDLLLMQDFEEEYRKRLNDWQLQDQIRVKTLEILGKDAENRLTDSRGDSYRYESAEIPEYCIVEAYIEKNEGEDDRILVMTGKKENAFILKNALITESHADGFYFLWAGKEMYCRQEEGERCQEKVADLTFAKGKITDIKVKNEKKSGILLGVTEEGVELENDGFLPFSQDYRVYRLFGDCKEVDRTELRIGYDFADYVMEKGKICAVLLVQDQNMESIRVAISDQDFKGIYHEKVILKADCDLNLIYGNYKDRQTKKLLAGEKITIDKDSLLLQGDRLRIEPVASSSRIQILSLKRAYGIPSYRGRMELIGRKQGIVLINELLLEEYLYSVVPSEMPASYPEEALRAQAVCARTYAYRYLLKAGLAEEGANVDDSVRFQVYNNIEESRNAREAVGETKGEMLFYEGAPIHAYYYSTSCGSGSDERAFGDREQLPYLNAEEISDREETKRETDLGNEKAFQKFLTEEHPEDYEKEEAWYRWRYEVKEIHTEKISGIMEENFSIIYDISVTERLDSGLATVLLLKTDTGDYEVRGEYRIRQVLSQEGKITRADGSEVTNGSLLPSAYLIISVEKDRGSVVGYTILGGGYGHGVGMSQNGAANMALAGWKKEEILSFFYRGADLITMY